MLPAFEGVRIRVLRGDEEALEGNGGSLERGELVSESERANGLDLIWKLAWVGEVSPPLLVLICSLLPPVEGIRWC